MTPQTSIGIMVVEDNRNVAEALERWMTKMPEVRWLGWTASAAEVPSLVASNSPDVVLMDLEIPGADIFTLIGLLNAEFPATRVIVLTGTARRDCVERALDAGAAGYLVKDERIPAIVEYAKRAVAGEVVLSHTARAAVFDQTPQASVETHRR